MTVRKSGVDFGEGKISGLVIRQAIPLIIAQLVQLLYNVVDRIYLGHMADAGSMALTGVGLTFPVITIIAAFTQLYGSGGAPLFAMARGAGEDRRAEKILGTVMTLIFITSLALMVFCMLFRKPILYLFGASDASYVYADQYIRIYLLGTFFSMTATGLNGFINALGYPRIGMMTVVIGAALNLVLDPLFIFVFGLGVAGAALATILSQAVSALWVLRFLTDDQLSLRLRRENLGVDTALTAQICKVGAAGFFMQATNSLVQILCNATLSIFGGDLYVGIMTVLNSVREIVHLPVSGVSAGAQPVMSFNYGAKKYERVRQAIVFNAAAGLLYTVIAWLIVFLFPGFFISLFTDDAAMMEPGIHALHVYFFGFVFMAGQMGGQSAFQALGMSKHAVFFSLLRKAIIVAPLTIILPRIGFGVTGVFLAEPISNVIGGSAAFITMYFKVYRKLGKEPIRGAAS